MSNRHSEGDDTQASKANGYLRDLYRNPKQAKVAGVCAGFADYFEVPNWVARLVFISLVIFTFQFAIIGYVVAIFLLAKRPSTLHENSARHSSHSGEHRRKVFHYGQPVSSRLQDIANRVQQIEKKVGKIETYVTSKKYQTNSEINGL